MCVKVKQDYGIISCAKISQAQHSGNVSLEEKLAALLFCIIANK